jgi:general secretion pathway protein J
MKPRGFSLIELLVAVAILSLAAALAYGALDGLVRTRAELERQSQRLQALQFAVGLIERDLRAAVDRPIQDAYGSSRLPALEASGSRIELSRSGHANVLAQPRAEIERVSYQLEGGQLQRLRHAVLDRAPNSVPTVQPLLDDVQRLEFRMIDASGREHGRWPPQSGTALPRAVELRLSTTGFGEIRRLLELPPGMVP